MIKEKPIDVYIFGAGASHAELPGMPVMDTFFTTLVEHADYGERDLWRCLTLLDYLRLFKSRHPECENLAAQIWLLRERKTETLLKKKVSEYLQVFKKRIDESSFAENLEDVFDRAVIAPITYGQSPRHRMLAAINRLFEMLTNEKGPTFPIFSGFVKKILQKKNRRSVFISFNYDLILDRTLFKMSSWKPDQGYGYKFRNTFTVNSTHKTSKIKSAEESDILLLKPHGSLSWRYEKNLGFDSGKTYLTVDNSGAPSQDKYYPDKTNQKWKDYHVLVVPPVPSKSYSHLVLYETRKLVKESLRNADTITIIGWSLPETDVDMKNMIQRIFDDVDNRHKQLQLLRIVDIVKAKSYYLRLQSLFMAKRNPICDTGFKDYVANL